MGPCLAFTHIAREGLWEIDDQMELPLASQSAVKPRRLYFESSDIEKVRDCLILACQLNIIGMVGVESTSLSVDHTAGWTPALSPVFLNDTASERPAPDSSRNHV